MITKFLKCTLSLILILSCAGCLKAPIKLKPLTKDTAHDSQTKQEVTVHAKKISCEEQKELFGNDAKQLQKYHIVPVQITVENKSEIAWVLANKNIALKLLSVDEVNKTLFAAKRLIPLWIFLGGVGAALICGGTCTALTIPAFWSYKTAAIAFGCFIAGTIILPTTFIATVDGVVNNISKQQMHKYLKNNCNLGGITINPDINASMLFFVKESDLPEKLNLLLTNNNLEKNILPFELAI